jgi:6,7-dimethyl-8-ribityllumazine synthase
LSLLKEETPATKISSITTALAIETPLTAVIVKIGFAFDGTTEHHDLVGSHDIKMEVSLRDFQVFDHFNK